MIAKQLLAQTAKSLAFALVASLLILPTPAAHAAAGGNGVCETSVFSGGTGQSAGTAWQIGTVEQLKELGDCKARSDYYELTSDIDLGGSANPWVPMANTIADEYSGFVGKLDGKGFKISNLYVPTRDVAGLFGYITPGAAISNLEIKSATVSGEVAGILAADIKMGVPVDNVTVSGTVYGSGYNFTTRVYVGGIAGRYGFYMYGGEVASSITLSNLVFQGSIIDRQGQSFRAGALFGQVGNNSAAVAKIVTIQSSSAQARVVQLESAEATGGLIGTAHNLIVLNSKINLQAEIYGSGDFGGVIGSGESFQLSGISVRGAVHAASNSAAIGGLAYQLRDDNDVATFLDPKIENSMVNLVVHSSGANNEFAGLVIAQFNGALTKNVVVSSVTGFASNKVSAVRALLTQIAGTTASVTGNLFDTTQTGIINSLPTGNLTAAEALGASSSSLSEIATLTNRSFDTSTIWNVSGIPFLRNTPNSNPIFEPIGLVSNNGESLQLFLGAAINSSPALIAGDFIVRVDGATRSVISASLSPTDSRVIDLALSTPVTRLQEVTVQYVQNQSPAVDYAYSLYPANTIVNPFSAAAINKVPYGTPAPSSGTLVPTVVESFRSTPISFTGTNLAESVIIMKPSWTGTRAAVEVTSFSDTQVNFIAPKLSTFSTSNRVYSVTVMNRSGSVLMSETITYLGSPSISAVSPNVGGRGTLVSIQGSNLSTATSVSFGTNVVSVNSVTSTSVTVIAPTGTAGATVSIAVQGPGWASTLSNVFRFTQSPSISAISSNSGLTTGGDSVTITGVTLSDLISVKFGTIQATVVSSTSTQIVVTTPAVASPGTVNVVVETIGGTSTLIAAFTYVSPPAPSGGGPSSGGLGSEAKSPEITQFSSKVITTNGGAITITGLRLEGITELKIGSLSPTISFNSATTVTMLIGQIPKGTWDLFLVNPYGQYTYQAALTVLETPIESGSFGTLLAYKWTLKFTNNSRKLNQEQIHALKALPGNLLQSQTLVCWGYTTAKNPNDWAKAHATQRARATCDQLAKQYNAKTIVRLRYGVDKVSAMRSAIQFWK